VIKTSAVLRYMVIMLKNKSGSKRLHQKHKRSSMMIGINLLLKERVLVSAGTRKPIHIQWKKILESKAVKSVFTITAQVRIMVIKKILLKKPRVQVINHKNALMPKDQKILAEEVNAVLEW